MPRSGPNLGKLLVCSPYADLLFVQRDVPPPNQQGATRSHRWPRISRDIFGAPGRGLACAKLKVCAARHLHHHLHLQRLDRQWHLRRRSPALRPIPPHEKLRHPRPLVPQRMRGQVRTRYWGCGWSRWRHRHYPRGYIGGWRCWRRTTSAMSWRSRSTRCRRGGHRLRPSSH